MKEFNARPIIKGLLTSLMKCCKKYGVDFDELLTELRWVEDTKLKELTTYETNR